VWKLLTRKNNHREKIQQQENDPAAVNKMLLKLTEMATHFKSHKMYILKNGLVDGRVKMVDAEEE